MTPTEQIRYIRQAGRIERCHMWPKTQSYTNARHLWGVAMLAVILYPDDHELLKLAILHDVPEMTTGDIPSPVIADLGLSEILEHKDRQIMEKLGLPDEHDLDIPGWMRLRALDRLELWLWAYEEEAMGNLAAKQMRGDLDELFDLMDAEKRMPREVWTVIETWRQTGGWRWMGRL